MSPRRRWVGNGHVDPELERSSAELFGKLEEMTDRLRSTVEALAAEEDDAHRRLRQEETDPPEPDPEDLRP